MSADNISLFFILLIGMLCGSLPYIRQSFFLRYFITDNGKLFFLAENGFFYLPADAVLLMLIYVYVVLPPQPLSGLLFPRDFYVPS
ncbi:hypothetical protein [Morganella psychrotolerans]|uniref:hypothetical protein n=1 Tax=Morganella psychrotolerans TaxID=368603 RepID=UPI0012E94018|nr:hypothetical protein [Morganella psychrotolerans]